MSRSADAIVRPELLVWGRESAHIPLEYAARKLNISVEKLKSWESGESRPTVKQLRRMAIAYKQTFAAFYLSEPPITSQPVIHDYRRFPSEIIDQMHLSIIFEIRSVLDRREVALELLEEIGESRPSFDITGSIANNPELLGSKVHDILGVKYSIQSKLNDNRLSFNFWRNTIENIGVLVFQSADVDLDIMRGFSICELPLPIIVVNRKDAYAARVFTLLHELAHLVIRTSGICDLDEEPDRPSEDQKVEVFCNHFAGACLVPSKQLLQEDIVIRVDKEIREFSVKEINQLALRYGVSSEVILRRLLILERIDKQFYQARRNQLIEEYKALPKRHGYISPVNDAISVSGRPFIRLVLDAFGSGKITTVDVSDYLGVRLKHINRIEEAISV